jgi:hypothetical protein
VAEYLLRADDADMARWKADATRRGVAFSEWLRDAAAMWELQPYVRAPLVRGPVEAASVAERLGPDGSEAASTGGAPSVNTAGADRPPASVQVSPPVDLREQARAVAARLQERVRE